MLQFMLIHTTEWCSDWCLKVNTNNSNGMYVRPKRLVRAEKIFALGNEQLEAFDDINIFFFMNLIETKALFFSSSSNPIRT